MTFPNQIQHQMAIHSYQDMSLHSTNILFARPDGPYLYMDGLYAPAKYLMRHLGCTKRTIPHRIILVMLLNKSTKFPGDEGIVVPCQRILKPQTHCSCAVTHVLSHSIMKLGKNQYFMILVVQAPTAGCGLTMEKSYVQ